MLKQTGDIVVVAFHEEVNEVFVVEPFLRVVHARTSNRDGKLRRLQHRVIFSLMNLYMDRTVKGPAIYYRLKKNENEGKQIDGNGISAQGEVRFPFRCRLVSVQILFGLLLVFF
jgi:hypothetical protein